MLLENYDIVQKNYTLFARYIKLETIIRNIYSRIELETVAAMRKLGSLEKEERKLIAALPAVDEGSISSIGTDTDLDEDDIHKESEIEKREGQLPNSLTLLSYKATIKDNETPIQRVRREKIEINHKLLKIASWRSSHFLKRTEKVFDDIISEVTSLKGDHNNFSVFCWKGMKGYNEIKKNAMVHRKRCKKFVDKGKEGKKIIKRLREAYAQE